MKKKSGLVLLSSVGIIYLVLNVILFIIINKTMPHQFKNGTFWFVWVMTFIFNAIVDCGIFAFYKGKEKYDVATVPALIYIMAIFNAVYIVLGLILMFIPKTKFTLALIFELIITAAYALFFIYFFSALGHMKKHDASKKVVFIRSLQADVDYAKDIVEDADLKKKLEALSEDIRFSDPMSQGEIIALDEKIQMTVGSILANAMDKNYDALNELVDNASKQLKYRNAKIKMLK